RISDRERYRLRLPNLEFPVAGRQPNKKNKRPPCWLEISVFGGARGRGDCAVQAGGRAPSPPCFCFPLFLSLSLPLPPPPLPSRQHQARRDWARRFRSRIRRRG